MYMRITVKKVVVILGVFLLLAVCKPSYKYAGEWYAGSNEGEVKVDFIKEKVLTLEDEEGKNDVKYYGLEMEGKDYYVVLDDKKDEDNAKLIVQMNHASDFEDVVGDIEIEMNRNEYPK